jgi:hypothetical protein
MASSSRSQVLAGTASAAARLAWDRPSVDVRGLPLLAVAIGTHLVTQSFVRARATCWPSTLALCITSVSRALLAGSSLLRCRRLLTLAVGSRCCGCRHRCCQYLAPDLVFLHSCLVAASSGWNSLEVAKLIVSAVTPIVVVGLGVVISRAARRLEHADWANRTLIERRLELYDKMAPLLNDLFCFFQFRGHFRDVEPPDAIAHKRQLDKIFYVNRFLMSEEFYRLYGDFISSCFKMHLGKGEDAKLRANKEDHREERVSWNTEWDHYYVEDESEMRSRGTVREKYEDVMRCFAREIGVGNSPTNNRRGIAHRA